MTEGETAGGNVDVTRPWSWRHGVGEPQAPCLGVGLFISGGVARGGASIAAKSCMQQLAGYRRARHGLAESIDIRAALKRLS